MNYWPLSAMLWSAELSPAQKNELLTIGTAHAIMSESTLTACYNLACKTPSYGGHLTVVSSEGVPLRRVYFERPTRIEWEALERGGFCTAFNNFGFVMDALH